MRTEATPHAIWKQFCRLSEHKAFVRRFGPGFAKRLDTFAIFEIGAEQYRKIGDLNLDADDPIPPFPFPKIALIFPDMMIALERPEMDLGAGVLEYESILYLSYEGSKSRHEEIAICRMRVDLARPPSDPQFAETLDFRSQVHLESGSVRDYPEAFGFGTTDAQERRTVEALGLLPQDKRDHLQGLIDKVHQHEAKIREQICEYLRACFVIGLYAIAWINRPKHYIVEQGPEIERRRSKAESERARRLGERARYILVDHEDVRRRWTNHHGTHGSPMPHLRRGHYKTLRAERYKEKRGKVIWVSPCHVGAECVQWREGAVSYKVVG